MAIAESPKSGGGVLNEAARESVGTPPGVIPPGYWEERKREKAARLAEAAVQPSVETGLRYQGGLVYHAFALARKRELAHLVLVDGTEVTGICAGASDPNTHSSQAFVINNILMVDPNKRIHEVDKETPPTPYDIQTVDSLKAVRSHE